MVVALALVVWLCPVLSVAQESAAQTGPRLTPDVRRMVELAADGPVDALAVTARIAAQALPGTEPEIMAIVARQAPQAAPDVAFALGLRPRTAPAAVAAAQAEASQAAIEETVTEAQVPRFWSFEGWEGSAALGSSRSTGNTEEVSVSADLDANRSHGPWSYELALKAELEGANGERTKQRFEGGVQVNRDFSERFYTFLTAHYENDRFSGFDYRVLLSPGMGYRAFTRDDLAWRLEAGPSVRFDHADDSNLRAEPGARLSSQFRWLPVKRLTLTNDTEAVISEGATLRNVAAAEAQIYGAFSLRLSYDVRYNFDPPVDTDSLDTTTKASLVYSF